MLKTIVGHTSARGICRYLTRKNRALASDYINIDAPDPARPEASFDWARVMDSTRRAFGKMHREGLRRDGARRQRLRQPLPMREAGALPEMQKPP